ncbi:bacillithiol biosynthesis cysteine-adding enzyme BshC [Ekhidna sp.]
MRTETLPLEETDCFSQFFIDYINKKEELKTFYSDFPSVKNFEKQIDERNFNSANREVLADMLRNQYEGLSPLSAVTDNIEALRGSKTFTITTGHQLNIFTGPLYFIYKIVTVINACKTLSQAYPNYRFVPVYWMASEDHDFDEINHFYFEGEKLEWKSNQTGAVGHFNPSDLQDIASKLPKGGEFFKDAYSKETLAAAGRAYVNHLFGEEGLVVVDADHANFKSLFRQVIEDDLFTHSAEKFVVETSNKLESIGYKTQVHPREINFFYLENGVRERIEKSENGFDVVNTDLHFSKSEMKSLIEKHPERFSPNVILRPLYQETILPNLAYVGGPSEAVYWLQLKAVFDNFKTPFPLLMPRNFALVISSTDSAKWEKTGLSNRDIFLSSEKAFTTWVQSNTKNELSFSDELNHLQELEDSLKKKTDSVDPTLSQHIEALYTSFSKRIENAEKKILRAEKRKHEDCRKQIESIKDSLFPGGTLQERRDNFLNFYLKNPKFIKTLLQTFDAFDYRMYMLYE